MVPISLAEMLHRARARLHRLDPRQAADAHSAGAVLIDIRSENQIAHDGVIPGALRISGNVLEWRVAPTATTAIPRRRVSRSR